MVDASDSKSDDSDIMWVQVPSPVFFYFKGAAALRMKYTKYCDNLIINLLYLVVLLLIATTPF